MSTTYNTATHQGTCDGISFTFEERRADRYSESSGSQNLSLEYTLKSDSAITAMQAKEIVSTVVQSSNLVGNHSSLGIPLTSVDIEHDNDEDLDRVWLVSLGWQTQKNDSSGSSLNIPKQEYLLNESFTTENGNAHIQQAVCEYSNGTYQMGETVYQVDSNDPGPSSFGGLIGYNGDSAEGCDVIRPSFSFTVQKKVYAGNLPGQMDGIVTGTSYTYRQVLALLTGSVNLNTFAGWSSGNCLFEGCSASTAVEYDETQTAADTNGNLCIPYILFYTITYKFRCALSFTNLPVSGTQINKEGFQYVWTYNRKEDSDGYTIDYPVCVVVNDVYPKRDFSLLGL